MRNFTVYTRFHRTAGETPQGAKLTSTMQFENLDALMAWADPINEATGDHAFHVTGASADNGDFVMFDMSIVADQIRGYDHILWLDDRAGTLNVNAA